MRCPNPVCREVFEVREAAAEETRPTATSEPAESSPPAEPNAGTRPQQHFEGTPTGTHRTTGSVGDLVPILDAEVVHEVPPPETRPDSSSTAAHVHGGAGAEQDEAPIPVDESL